MRYERKAFLTVTADSEVEADQMFGSLDGELVGDGVLVSLEDGGAEEVDDDE